VGHEQGLCRGRVSDQAEPFGFRRKLVSHVRLSRLPEHRRADTQVSHLSAHLVVGLHLPPELRFFHGREEEYSRATRRHPRPRAASLRESLDEDHAGDHGVLREMTRTELQERKLGHNLEALLDRSKKLGLHQYVAISDKERSQISLINDYCKNRHLEYFDLERALRGFSDLPSLPTLDRFLSNTLNSMKSLYCS